MRQCCSECGRNSPLSPKERGRATNWWLGVLLAHSALAWSSSMWLKSEHAASDWRLASGYAFIIWAAFWCVYEQRRTSWENRNKPLM
jgi:hypothetical protein